MSLVNENGGMVMPVGPMYGNGNGGSFGWGGDGSFWIIILFLFAMFGNGWGGWGNGNGCGAVQVNNDMQRGFDQQAIMNSLSGINSSLSAAEVSRCNTQANILQTLNQNQSAANQAMNSLAMSLQNCCCENRLAICQQTNALQSQAAQNAADVRLQLAQNEAADQLAVCRQTNELATQADRNTNSIVKAIADQNAMIVGEFCALKERELQSKIDTLHSYLHHRFPTLLHYQPIYYKCSLHLSRKTNRSA